MPGKRRIRCLLVTSLICFGAFGCATAPPAYRPTFPVEPTLEVKPLSLHHEGKRYIVMLYDDWLSISAWVLNLERELKAACLALGWAEGDCRPEAPRE